METMQENVNKPKQRHGCATAWLILMIVANSFTAISYLFANDMTKDILPNVSTTIILVLGVLAIANVIFAVLLLRWKKVGFWGFLITSSITFIINLSIGTGIAPSIFGLLGIAILYGVLQMKKDNEPAWEFLE